MNFLNNDTLVSIVMCTYNGQAYLSKAIQSALSQTYKNIEVIIIDDGSTDLTKSIILEFASKDPRVKYFFRKNRGLPSARNDAFENASGQWIAVIDQDDICYPNRIEAQLNTARKFPSAGLIFSDTDYIDAEGLVIGTHLRKFKLPNEFICKGLAANLLIRQGCFVDSEAWFMKKEVYINHGGLKENLRYACDYEYFIRCGLDINFAYTTEILSAWRVHPDQESNTNPRRFSEYRDVLRSFLGVKHITISTTLFIFKNIMRSYLGIFYRGVKSKFLTPKVGQ